MPPEIEVDDPQEEDFDAEAKALGWQPEEEFQGDKSRWIPAKEFVEKGRHVVPILQQNNRRLQKELLTRDQKIGKLNQDVEKLNEAFGEVEKKLAKVDQAAFARAKAQLTAELKAAREDGNIDAEIAVQDKMDQLRKAADEVPEKKPPVKSVDTPIELDPILKEWMGRNTWFGDQSSPENKKRTKEFLRIREDLIEDGFEGNMGEAITAVEKEYEKRHPTSRGTSKVEGGGRTTNGSGNSTSKTYTNLPTEAKAACMEFADSLVGKGKRYETVDAWQKKYAKDYYEDEQK